MGGARAEILFGHIWILMAAIRFLAPIKFLVYNRHYRTAAKLMTASFAAVIGQNRRARPFYYDYKKPDFSSKQMTTMKIWLKQRAGRRYKRSHFV